jgi:hypothetical protein
MGFSTHDIISKVQLPSISHTVYLSLEIIQYRAQFKILKSKVFTNVTVMFSE